MKNFHSLLCSKNFRESLAKKLTKYAPELLECDPNNHVHNCVMILEYNNPNGEGRSKSSWFGYKGKDLGKPVHHFILILANESYMSSFQCLWEIFEESSLDEIPYIATRGCWGLKLRDGLIYPDIGYKVQRIIINFIREYKLKRITNEILLC